MDTRAEQGRSARAYRLQAKTANLMDSIVHNQLNAARQALAALESVAA